MATDCKKFSAKAQEIFNQLEQFFPPDPWKNPAWFSDGHVLQNGSFDLRLSADRTRLAEKTKSFLGYLVEMEAVRLWEMRKTLVALIDRHFTRLMAQHAELLMILNDLDFQIETGDLVD